MNSLTHGLPDSGAVDPVDAVAAFLDAWRTGGGGAVVAEAGGVRLSEAALSAVLGAAADLFGLEDLQLSRRVCNALRTAGIRTVSQLVRRTPEQLMDVRNLGVVGVAAIERALAARPGPGLPDSGTAGPDTGAAPAAAPAPPARAAGDLSFPGLRDFRSPGV